MLHVRIVKGGTAAYSIPVSDTFADKLNACEGEGYALAGTPAQRSELIKAHGTWLKGILEETDTLSEQSNHRLRDTVASICFSTWGRDVASEMLGNGKEVNRRHYARLRINVTPLMRAELAHAARLHVSTQPANVVPIEQCTAAA
jgi:hypothetical protein